MSITEDSEKRDAEIFLLKSIINSLLFALDYGEYEGLEDNIALAREVVGGGVNLESER